MSGRTALQCLGPLAVESSAAGVPGLLLAGDSAGFIDPMTGDGLRFLLELLVEPPEPFSLSVTAARP